MNGIIIYKTNCGSTKQYAQWLSEKTGYKAVALADAKNIDLSVYDTIIIGSLVIASKITICNWLLKQWKNIKDKKVILFSTSGAKPDTTIKKEFLSNSLPESIAKNVAYFPMHGRRRHKDLGLIARLMMWIAVTFIAKTSQEKEEMAKDFDGVDKKYIEPLISYIQ